MNTRRSPVVLLTCFLGLAAALPTAAAERVKRPNVLFLLSDDQRPDAVGALGNEVIRTPHLDRLARQGVVFTRAICANPICTPSRAEIISGCSGFRNGVLDFGRPIDPRLATWADTLRQAGYETCYVGKWHNRGRPLAAGYERTLGLYGSGGGRWAKDQVDWKGSKITGYRGWVFQSADGKSKYPEQGVGLTADISKRFADAAIEFLNGKHDRPFFLHVNFTAPHDPLLMPPGFAGRYEVGKMRLPTNYLPRHPFDHGNAMGRDERLLPFPRPPQTVREVIAMYYAVVSHMDRQIGRVLEVLKRRGLQQNTIVIFASDHGVALGSHGLRGKQNMYEHTIGVPLILRGPGIPSDVRRNAQVYLRDLFPTTCDLAGVPIPKTVEGRSLKAVISGEKDEVYRYVYGYFRDKQRMIRGRRWKLIRYPRIERRQLFDLKRDPHELHDLSDSETHATKLAELERRLLSWQRSVGDKLLGK